MKGSTGENHLLKFLDFCEEYGLGETSILGFSSSEGIDTTDSNDFLISLTGHLQIALVMTKAYTDLKNKFKDGLSETLPRKFSKLLGNNEWDLKRILSLIDKFQKIENAYGTHIDKALDMIIAYDLSEQTHNATDSIIHILDTVNPAEWHLRLHELGITKAFASPKERTLDELLELV